jgi:putative transposase
VARNFVANMEEHQPFKFLVRDRDTKFTANFDAVMASAGIKIMRTPVQTPVANAFAERWVRSARRECLDHLLVASRRQLESVLCEYVRHYNRARPHRGLHLAVPQPYTAPDHGGKIVRHDVLGGIIHEYERAA